MTKNDNKTNCRFVRINLVSEFEPGARLERDIADFTLVPQAAPGAALPRADAEQPSLGLQAPGLS